jgi:integrase
MARTIRSPKLDTRNARSRLPIRREPFWTSIGAGLFVGYRHFRQAGGSWLARAYDPVTGKHRQMSIGPADDHLDADGATVFTFFQAQEMARAWYPKAFANMSEAEAHDADAPVTVADATDSYVAWLAANRRPTSAREAGSHARAHINPSLGSIRLDRLTATHLRRFHEAVAARPARIRSSPGGVQKVRETVGEDGKRRRRSTANRVLTTLKAALARAAADHPGLLPGEPWRAVKPFRNADSARVRYLSLDECHRLLNAAPEDVGRLIRAALLTGCRYGELCRLVCADFHRESGTLHIAQAKAGARTIPLDDEGWAFFASLTAGRGTRAPILLRATGRPWQADHQKRPMIDASTAARLDPPATLHCLRHTYASLRIMAGAPLPAIAAALGHSDTRMVSKHYGHLAPSWVADAIRATALGIGSGEEAAKVQAIR